MTVAIWEPVCATWEAAPERNPGPSAEAYRVHREKRERRWEYRDSNMRGARRKGAPGGCGRRRPRRVPSSGACHRNSRRPPGSRENAALFSNAPCSRASEIRVMSWRITRPAPMVMCPTSELPICPAGRPTASARGLELGAWEFLESAGQEGRVGSCGRVARVPVTDSEPVEYADDHGPFHVVLQACSPVVFLSHVDLRRIAPESFEVVGARALRERRRGQPG